jgi:hypothetical protein
MTLTPTLLALLLAAPTPQVPEAPAKRQEDPRAGKETSPAARPGPGLPWPKGVEYRYLWIRDGQKAGETRFGLEETSRDGKPCYVITATRTYDWEGNSQRARSTTVLLGGGEPLAFDEALEMSGLNNLKAHQLTEIRFRDGKAHLKYILNGKEEAPRLREVDFPARAFLHGNQAVEHWAVFASKLPRGKGRHVLELFYPDHGKVFAVAFEKQAEEKLRLGAGEADAARFRFECPEARLSGSIWLDAAGRLLQVEFRDPGARTPTLRVVLEKKP